MSHKSKTLDMVNGPLLKNIILFSLPLMLSNLLQIALNAADTIIVGKFSGQIALAAVGATGSIVNLLSALFIGLSTGANIVIARFIGKNERNGISQAVHTSYFLGLVGGLIMSVIGITLAKILLTWMATPDDILALSTLYMRIYFIGAIPQCIYNFGAAILRAKGDTQRPTYYLMMSGILNVLFNLLFVIVFDMSVAGVAIATVISETIAAILVTSALLHEQDDLKLIPSKISLDTALGKEILRIGIPVGLQSMMWSISNVVIQSRINSFGAIAVAGNSAAANIEGFVYIGMGAFSQSCVTFTSQNVGAKRKDNILKIFQITMFFVTVSSFLIGFVVWYFGDFFLSLYTSDALVIEMGKIRLFYVVLFLFINGILDIPANSMRGMGYSTTPTVLMFLGIVVVRIIYIFTIWTINPTLEMLYLCFPISWVITLILQGGFWYVHYQRLKL